MHWRLTAFSSLRTESDTVVHQETWSRRRGGNASNHWRDWISRIDPSTLYHALLSRKLPDPIYVIEILNNSIRGVDRGTILDATLGLRASLQGTPGHRQIYLTQSAGSG